MLLKLFVVTLTDITVSRWSFRCRHSVPGNRRPGGVREDLLGPGNTSPGVRVTQVREDTSPGNARPGNTSPGDSCQGASARWVWALWAQTQRASGQRRARLNLT